MLCLSHRVGQRTSFWPLDLLSIKHHFDNVVKLEELRSNMAYTRTKGMGQFKSLERGQTRIDHASNSQLVDGKKRKELRIQPASCPHILIIIRTCNIVIEWLRPLQESSRPPWCFFTCISRWRFLVWISSYRLSNLSCTTFCLPTIS